MFQQWRELQADDREDFVLAEADSASAGCDIDVLLTAGIPPDLRGRRWWTCSGAAEKRTHAHLEALGLDLEPFTLKWFLCLFLHTLPYDVALRVWDLFFCQGRPVLLRVGLTLLQLTQAKLLACGDVIDVYQVFTFSSATLRTLTAPYRKARERERDRNDRDRTPRDEGVGDTIVRLAMDPTASLVGPIAMEALHELRLLYRNQVVDELKQVMQAHGSTEGNLLQEEESSEAGRCRHAQDEHEMAEYDFVAEYAYECEDISPTKYIHFADLYESADASNVFVDVEYDGPMGAVAEDDEGDARLH